MPNEINLLLTFISLALLLLLCTRFGRTYIYIFSVGCILVSNITVSKQVTVFGLSMSLGVVIYSLVYLATDICSEYGDKLDAYRLAIANLLAQVVFFAYMQLSVSAGAASFDTAGKMIEALFTTTPRITIAAIIAAFGAFVDIWIYEALKKKWRIGRASVIIRNNSSTFLGQAVNTLLFFIIAFYGVLDNLKEIIITAIMVKWVIAILDSYFLIIAAKMLPPEWKSNLSWATNITKGKAYLEKL